MVRFLHVSFFFFFVALLGMLLCKLDSLYFVDVGMDFNLGVTMDSLVERGHESDDDPPPALLKRRKARDGGAQQPADEEATQLSDDPADAVPPPVDIGGSPGRVASEREGSPLPDFKFPPSRGYSEMRAVKSLVAPRRVQSIACRSADDIERVLSVHTQRVGFFFLYLFIYFFWF
jgi:hypothetical protein